MTGAFESGAVLVAGRISEGEGYCAGGVVCVCGCVTFSGGARVIVGVIGDGGNFLDVGIYAGRDGAGGLAMALIQALRVEIFPGRESVAGGLQQNEFVEAFANFPGGGVIALFGLSGDGDFAGR